MEDLGKVSLTDIQRLNAEMAAETKRRAELGEVVLRERLGGPSVPPAVSKESKDVNVSTESESSLRTQALNLTGSVCTDTSPYFVK